MKTYLHLLYIAVCTACCCIGCQSKPKNTPQHRSITVSIEPLRYLAEQIAGEEYEVTTLVPKGDSPETYEPTPEQIIRLGESTVYFSIGGLGFEQTWAGRLQQNAPGVTFVQTAEGIDLIRQAHVHDGHVSHADPHVWTSPKNMEHIAQTICESLCRIDSAQAETFRDNLENTLTEIRAVDDSIRRLIAPIREKAFLIYHPTLTYFAQDYGLIQIPIEHEGKEPSPARLVELAGECKAHRATVVFVQQEFDRKNAEIIAKETDTRIVGINPLSYDWPQEMLHIAQTLHAQ